jgi:hypothetical protein
MHVSSRHFLLQTHTLHPALEDGTNRGFRNVGKLQSDAGEIPKRIHTIQHICPSCNSSAWSPIASRSSALAVACISAAEYYCIHIWRLLHFIDFQSWTRSSTQWCLHTKCMFRPVHIPQYDGNIYMYMPPTYRLHFLHCHLFLAKKDCHDWQSESCIIMLLGISQFTVHEIFKI